MFKKSVHQISLVLVFSFFNSIATEAMQGSKDQPRLMIKAIHNNTPYNLFLIDRKHNKVMHLPANQVKEFTAFEVKNHHKVSLQGSMLPCMIEQAQYALVEIDAAGEPSSTNVAFLNMNLMPGGINDGSGIIIGSLGSTVFQFLIAGLQGGCQHLGQTLKNTENKTVEITLDLSMHPAALRHQVFILDASCQVTQSCSSK